jgi:hypothetical protein
VLLGDIHVSSHRFWGHTPDPVIHGDVNLLLFVEVARFRIAAVRTKRVIHVMPPVTEIAIEEPKAPFVWRHYFLRFIGVESK